MTMFEMAVELRLFFKGFEAAVVRTPVAPFKVELLVHLEMLLELEALVAVRELTNKRSDINLFRLKSGCLTWDLRWVFKLPLSL